MFIVVKEKLKKSLLSFILGSVVKSFTKTQDCKGIPGTHGIFTDIITNTGAICNTCTKITMKILEILNYSTICDTMSTLCCIYHIISNMCHAVLTIL